MNKGKKTKEEVKDKRPQSVQFPPLLSFKKDGAGEKKLCTGAQRGVPYDRWDGGEALKGKEISCSF